MLARLRLVRQQRGQFLAVVDLIIGGYRAGGRLITTMHCIQGLILTPGTSKSTLSACRTGEFWIACDFCDTWYDGKCVQVGLADKAPLQFIACTL